MTKHTEAPRFNEANTTDSGPEMKAQDGVSASDPDMRVGTLGDHPKIEARTDFGNAQDQQKVPTGAAGVSKYAKIWLVVFAICGALTLLFTHLVPESERQATQSSESVVGVWDCQTTNPRGNVTNDKFAFGNDGSLAIYTEIANMKGSYTRRTARTYFLDVGATQWDMEVKRMTATTLEMSTVSVKRGIQRVAVCARVRRHVS